ncbi:hypothetical protein RND81_09G000500 [Saponaria officinalis]|uniref:Uncharacterized protein n=1 Tax=Saponaria officinalis TaxID=3572 RepID=A0AAW1IG96_SAPOF
MPLSSLHTTPSPTPSPSITPASVFIFHSPFCGLVHFSIVSFLSALLVSCSVSLISLVKSRTRLTTMSACALPPSKTTLFRHSHTPTLPSNPPETRYPPWCPSPSKPPPPTPSPFQTQSPPKRPPLTPPTHSQPTHSPVKDVGKSCIGSANRTQLIRPTYPRSEILSRGQSIITKLPNKDFYTRQNWHFPNFVPVIRIIRRPGCLAPSSH